MISRDMKGYYVQFNLARESTATIVITDCPGRQEAVWTMGKIDNKRVYINALAAERKQLLVVRVQAGQQVLSRKLFNE